MLRPDFGACASLLRHRIVRTVVVIVLIFVVGVALIFLIVEIFPHHRRRTIVPRAVHVQISRQLRPQLGQNLLSRQHVPKGVIVEILHHLVRDDDGILGLPRLRPVLQDVELNRKPIFMSLDERIHSTRVSIKIRTIPRTRHLQRFPGRRPQSQDALLAVDLERVLAKNLREFSGSEAPHHIHLPQPVLRRHVALSEKQIFQRGGLDRRHAVAIPRHFHGRRKAFHLKFSVKLGQRQTGDEIGISSHARRQQDENQQEPQENAYARSNAGIQERQLQ